MKRCDQRCFTESRRKFGGKAREARRIAPSAARPAAREPSQPHPARPRVGARCDSVHLSVESQHTFKNGFIAVLTSKEIADISFGVDEIKIG